VLQKSLDELIHIAAAGGGFTIEAGTFPSDDLVRIAAAAAGTGAQIVIHGVTGRSTEDLVRIAGAGRGSVRFD
jgi:DNA replication protein